MNTKTKIIPTTHRSLATLIGDITRISGQTSLRSIASTTFGDLEKSLNDSLFRLAILGPWNSGKSCLINRIIGEDNPQDGLLPVKDEPTTAKLTYLSFGESPELKKIDEDGGDAVLLAKGEDKVRQAIKEEAVKKERSSLLVRWPLEFCRAGGELVDTPGLFDPDEERSLVTLDALEKFHAVIFVVPAQMPVNTEILQFIEEHFIKRTHAKFFFLINKIDWLRGENVTVEQYLDECHNKLTAKLGSRYGNLRLKGDNVPDVTHLLKRERFFGVSSKHGDGMEQTSSAIRQFLSEGSRELVHVAFLKMEEVLGSLEIAIGEEERARHIEQGRLDEPYEELASIERKFLQHMNETEQSLPREFGAAVESSGRKIRKLMKDLREEGTGKLDYSFWKQITKPDQIRQEIVALQRELVEKAEDVMHDMQENLRDKIQQILGEYHKSFIIPTTDHLKKVADKVDKTLSAYDQKAPGEIGKRSTIKGADDAGSQDDNANLHAAGAGVLGAGAGAAVAFGTGAAFTTTAAVVGTTSTIVSTAASWVPLWVAQTLGMTTTVTTPIVAAVPVLSGVMAAILIAAPAAAAVITCLAILNKIKSSRNIRACQELLDQLPEKHTTDALENLKGEIGIMAKGCLDGMKSYVGGIISRLRDYIDHLKTASTQDKAPAEITELAKHIKPWRDAIGVIKKENELP